jgi:hypothetical protein
MDETPEAVPDRSAAAHPAASPPAPLWLREALVILVSVALGFGASEFGQYRQERGVARVVLSAVVEEVRQNETLLSAAVVKHREWQQALGGADGEAAGKAAFSLLLSSRPKDAGSIMIPLRSAAWQMTVSSGALRLLDFEVGQAISEIYSMQMALTEHHMRALAGVIWSPDAFDAAQSAITTKLLWAVMGEVAGNEDALVSLYRKHLPLLERAAGNQ